MGSYYIPNNKLKGEGRILYIFTSKSLIFTAVGAGIGLLLFNIFNMIGLRTIGIICLVIMALIGFGIATIKIPTHGGTTISKNVGGESLNEIIIKYIKFKKNRKIYTYAVERKDQDATGVTNPLTLLNLNKKGTKEEVK